MSAQTDSSETWSPMSWRSKPVTQDVDYARHPEHPHALERALAKLRSLPPLVTSWEVERLKALIADAQKGKRFLLQGGDCAETLADCRPEQISSKLKILLQMSLVLIHGSQKPVIRVGRFAGQYAKPRSKPLELQGDLELPSYFGDLINRADFTESARTPDPHMLVRGYQHAAMTINFIRSLATGGFADLHHPESWELGFLSTADLPDHRKAQYHDLMERLADGLRFMEALSDNAVHESSAVEFFTSHEGLNLYYESAQTRTVPRRAGHYDLTTHLPWIGERTRDLAGAHIEFFRGIRNPVGVKVGPTADPAEIVRLIETLNPCDEPGKMILITRMGAKNAASALPPILEAVRDTGKPVLWVSDPMHGNAQTTSTGIKTRSFDNILAELEMVMDAHEAAGTILGGVHFELTGEDVTECIGGASGITEDQLSDNYVSLCDPRLNYQQSLELAFLLAGRFRAARTSG